MSAMTVVMWNAVAKHSGPRRHRRSIAVVPARERTNADRGTSVDGAFSGTFES